MIILTKSFFQQREVNDKFHQGFGERDQWKKVEVKLKEEYGAEREMKMSFVP